MIIPPESGFVRKAFYHLESKFVFPLVFRKLEVRKVPIIEGHSVLMLQNHISWWDGFWGNYLAYHYLGKRFHVMTQEDQMIRHTWLRHRGAFSIRKHSREMLDSIQYASKVLGSPSNMVLVFPQGKLQSVHATEIILEKGLYRLLEKLPEKCQVIYNAVTIEYLEGFRPWVQFHMYDCGVARGIDREELQGQVNTFHQQVLQGQVRP